VDDRIFSTSVDLEYTFSEIPLKAPGDAEKLQFAVPEGVEDGSVWDEEVPGRAREATLEVFAEDESASVQVSGVWEIVFGRLIVGFFGMGSTTFPVLPSSSLVRFCRSSFVLVILIHFCVYFLCAH
jgi:hypothetical protein